MAGRTGEGGTGAGAGPGQGRETVSGTGPGAPGPGARPGWVPVLVVNFVAVLLVALFWLSGGPAPRVVPSIPATQPVLAPPPPSAPASPDCAAR